MPENISRYIDLKELIRVRRELHRIPETAFEEYETSSYIAERLNELGLDVETGFAGTAVMGVLKVPGAITVTALRADMDALPFEERNDVEYRSMHPGKAHLCGHDAHMACVYGAARELILRKEELRSSVKFIFQPGEELPPGGAVKVLGSGVLSDADRIFSLHCSADFPAGALAMKPGTLMANDSRFVIRVNGRGGHAAAPHQCIDPIVVAANIIQLLQQNVSRKTDPLETLLITFGKIRAGDVYNAIPDTAVLEGAIRTLEPHIYDKMFEEFDHTVNTICRASGADCDITFDLGYPPVVNDPEIVEYAAETLSKLPEFPNVICPINPVMYGEDFAYYLKKMPGMMMFLGVRNDEAGIVHPLHSPYFNIDESALATGAHALAELVLNCRTG